MDNRNRTVTVKDVATHAGVSTATVSRVINGDPKVKPETAKHVQDSIKALGYRMNQVARSLKTNKTHTIGIIAPEFSNDFFMNIVTGVEQELQQFGYSVILCSSSEDVIKEKEQIQLLNEKNVDGAIIIPGSHTGKHFSLFQKKPIVLVDRTVEDFKTDAVLSDNYRGAFEAVQYSIGKGARRIGFLGGDMGLTSARERYEGYLAALEEGGLEADDSIILFGDYHIQSGYTLMNTLMKQPQPPRHIFISNYFMHLGAARYLMENPGNPSGLHILSFDDMPLASFFPYSSIIIAQPMEEIGRKAAGILLERISGNSSEPREIRLPTTMRILD